MGERDFAGQSVTEHEAFLRTLLASEVQLPGGGRKSVERIIHRDADDPKKFRDFEAERILEDKGVRLVERRSNRGDALFVAHLRVCRSLLKDTDYADQAVDQLLMRLDGASKTKQRLGGGGTEYGIAIPVETIAAVMGTQEEELCE